jgi:hypothetical protein
MGAPDRPLGGGGLGQFLDDDLANGYAPSDGPACEQRWVRNWTDQSRNVIIPQDGSLDRKVIEA